MATLPPEMTGADTIPIETDSALRPPLGWRRHCSYVADGPEETAALAARLAPLLLPGDTLLLIGDLGSGKTHAARALIRARLGDPHAEVPSPSFTLVQIYGAPGGEIWHADLYRLTDPAEVWELGLEVAFDTAICLIEWPDRMGEQLPAQAAALQLETDPAAPDRRHLHLLAPDGSALAERLAEAWASG